MGAVAAQRNRNPKKNRANCTEGKRKERKTKGLGGAEGAPSLKQRRKNVVEA